MRVRLTQIDGAKPNLALMRLAHFYRALGFEVTLTRAVRKDLFEPEYDLVLGSQIFDFSKNKADELRANFPGAVIKGTGTGDFETVEHFLGVDTYEHYDYTDYPDFPHSIGFTQRGCRLSCKFCLTPESLVITESGPKAISEIKVGESVLTHKGRYRRVTHVLSRPFNGEVFTLRSGAISELFPTTLTGEHPVWTRRVSYRSGGQRLTSFKWIDAGEIKEGHPQRSRDTFAYPRTVNDCSSVVLNPPGIELPLTSSLMTLLGWYIAEGYVTESKGRGYHRVTFCLGHSETERGYAEEIVEAASNLGLKAKVYHPKIGIRVCIENVRLARWLISEFGTGSSYKTLPLWLRLLPYGHLKPFVDAWANGDGWRQIKKGTETWKVTTVSLNLIIGLREITLRMGLACTINRHHASDTIQGRKVNVKPAYTAIFHETREVKRSITSDEEYVYSPVRASVRSQYEGLVFNLEVEEDNSYCTPAFALHNCIVPKKEGKVRGLNSINDIWRGGGHPKQILLLDNDFFGQPEWKERAEEIIDGDFEVCFNQGINVRLIHEEGAAYLARMKYRDDQFKTKRIYTAWDNRRDEGIFFKGIDTLTAAGIKPGHILVYMLCGYWPNEDFERDVMYRFRKMVDAGLLPYPMVYDPNNKTLKRFQRWAVRRYHQFIPWEDYGRKILEVETGLFGRAEAA